MKKKILILILCAIGALCGGLLLAACSTQQLSAPEYLRVESSDNGDILRWKEVKDAESYVVDIDGHSMTTRRTEFTLSRFDREPGECVVKVKACGEGLLDSEWAYVDYVMPDLSGIVYMSVEEGSYIVSGVGRATGVIVVEDEHLGLPVVAIGAEAFIGATEVTEVILGKNIKTIGDRAFFNCSSLTRINIPEGLSGIGSNAFNNCMSLEEITIPGTVENIADNAFSYCRAMKKATISEGVKTIGNNAFRGCESLVEVVTPSTTERIGASAFKNCGSLRSITVNGKDVVIYSEAFYGCGAVIGDDKPLEENELTVKLGDVVEIYSGTFAACSALKHIAIPDSVIGIRSRTFFNCVNLESVTLGSGITEVGFEAFDNTAVWNNADDYVVVGDWFIELKNKKYAVGDFRKAAWRGIAEGAFFNSSLQSAYQLPDTLEYINDEAFVECKMSSVILGDNVKIIGDSAFYMCKNLRSVVLGNSVEKIGSQAFAECEVLTPVNSSGGKNINIPNSVKKIGSGIFDETAFSKNATGIMLVDNWVVGCNPETTASQEIPSGVIGISDGAFANCRISGIYIPDTVGIIGEYAFMNCNNIRSITLPSRLEEIKQITFYMCSSLESIVIPNGVKTIESNAFRSCRDLKSVDIPDSVQTIGEYAFSFCDYLESVKLGNSVSEIKEYAFAYCVSLKEIKLPNSVKDVSDYAFYRCSALESVDLGNARTIGSHAFYQCTMLSKLEIPDSVVSIGELAFYRCLALQKLKIGENVSSIADSAFYGCENLIKAEIPDSVESIGNSVFMDCFALQSVTIGANLISIGNHAFMNCDKLTIYTEANKKYSGWSDLWNSQYRPVVYGCNLSPDKDYVDSITISADTVINGNAMYGVLAPQRLGWTFAGWATVPGGNAVYNAEEIVNIQDGVTLYAVWEESEELPRIGVLPEYRPYWDTTQGGLIISSI